MNTGGVNDRINCPNDHVVRERQAAVWVNHRPGSAIIDIDGLDFEVNGLEHIVHTQKSRLCEERATHRELDGAIASNHDDVCVICCQGRNSARSDYHRG